MSFLTDNITAGINLGQVAANYYAAQSPAPAPAPAPSPTFGVPISVGGAPLTGLAPVAGNFAYSFLSASRATALPDQFVGRGGVRAELAEKANFRALTRYPFRVWRF